MKQVNIRHPILVVLLILVGILLVGGCVANDAVKPSPTPTPTISVGPSPTPLSSPSITPETTPSPSLHPTGPDAPPASTPVPNDAAKPSLTPIVTTNTSPSPTLSSSPTVVPQPTPSPTADSAAPNVSPIPISGELRALKVYFIDVGQGDSIFIDLDEIEVLIDGGDRSPGVVDYLSNYVDGSLEVMIATHPHADHIGGLIDVLAAYDVNSIWHNGDSSTSKTYADFMKAVEAEGADIHIARRGDVIQTDDLLLRVLHPANLRGTTNNNSIVLHLAYGDTDFLFMGDAEAEAEGEILVQSVVPVPDVDVLKVGHHASRSSSSSQFLELIRPEIAVYMAGKGNSYGHPHQETLVTLESFGCTIYGTDVSGTVVVEIQDEGLMTSATPVGEPHSNITPPSAASSVASITPPSGRSADCDCSRDIYNCADFGSQAEAQSCYQHCLEQVGKDVHRLDGDNDGKACEGLG